MARWLVLCSSAWLAGCRAIVGPDVSYRDCDLSHYEDEFLEDTTMEAFLERCWRLDNVSEKSEVRVTDGDLVMRINDPLGGAFLQWSGADQGPLAFQRLEQNFLVVARLEALHPQDASHCLDTGNVAGLVVRSAESRADWVTFLIGPYGPDALNPEKCSDDSPEKPPTRATVQPSSGGQVVTGDVDVGLDGDAFLSVCRVGSVIEYAYRDPDAPGTWHAVESLPFPGPLEVGPALSAAAPTFQIEGHFDWIVFENQVSDGCENARQMLALPAWD